jgi:hypothetical protein
MDKEKLETIKKKTPIVGFYFLFVYLLAQYPVVTGTDLIFLLVLISYIAILLFVFPWKKLDKLEGLKT